MDKLNVGVEGLDPLLFGGLPKGRSYLVSGEPGTGKTIFCLQFLLTGLQNGERAMYVTFDEKPDHIIADAKELGWDLEPYFEKGLLQILDVTTYFGSLKKADGSTLDLEKTIYNISKLIQDQGVSRLAMDPIVPIILMQEQTPEVIGYIRQLIFTLESKKTCTSLMTSYVPVGSQRLSSHGVEEFAASGIFVLKLLFQDHQKIRGISIRKMRGSCIDFNDYHFDILKNRGIVIRQAIT